MRPMGIVLLASILWVESSSEEQLPPVMVETKDCQLPPEDFAAPVFDSGDNLSFPKCGLWDKQKSTRPPWRAVIYGIKHYCPTGILISPTSVLTRGCPRLAKEFLAAVNKKDFEARLGQCHVDAGQFPNSTTYRSNGRGSIVKVEAVTELEIPNTDTIRLWSIEKVALVENRIWPICLFNKNNQFQHEQNYQIHHIFWNASRTTELVSDPLSCLPKLIQTNLCDEIKHSVCALLDSVQDSGYDYLLNSDSKRYFLRGFITFYHKVLKTTFFTDIVYYTKEIVSKTSDMVVMPEIPTPRIKTDFRSGTELNQAECGGKPRINRRTRPRRDRPTTSFIADGEEADEGQHPWHASISTNYGDEDIEKCEFCGATLISKRALLTAAHCMFDQINRRLRNASELSVNLGMRDRFSQNESWQTLTPSRVIVHPGYVHPNHDHDLALLLFEDQEFNLTASVRPICLWNKDYALEAISNKTGEVVGWGLTENHTQPDVLHRAEVPVWTHKDCYLQDRKFYSKHLKPGRNFCAGLEGKGSCVGDSGGGFALKQGGKWFLRGVVSFGASKTVRGNKTTCDPQISALYVDLAEYMDWIVKTVVQD